MGGWERGRKGAEGGRVQRPDRKSQGSEEHEQEQEQKQEIGGCWKVRSTPTARGGQRARASGEEPEGGGGEGEGK